MAQFPVLPLWVEKWTHDTRHLSRAERGLYMDWLIVMWDTPGCRVPADLSWSARKLGCQPDELVTLKALRDEFMSSDGNWLTQKRLTKEYNFQLKTRRRQSANSKARWDKEKGASHGNATSGIEVAYAPSPSPTEISPPLASLADPPGKNWIDEAELDPTVVPFPSRPA